MQRPDVQDADPSQPAIGYVHLSFAVVRFVIQRQTSKDVGANVEGNLEANTILHTFALSKDENKV